MTTASNVAFYRDVLGVPVEQAEHLDDVQPCLIPVSDNEGDQVVDAAGIDDGDTQGATYVEAHANVSTVSR